MDTDGVFAELHCAALMFDMFCVSLFSPGVILYMYDGDYVNVFGHEMKRDWYLAIYNCTWTLEI